MRRRSGERCGFATSDRLRGAADDDLHAWSRGTCTTGCEPLRLWFAVGLVTDAGVSGAIVTQRRYPRSGPG
jgi:hypothetical protein